MKEASYSEKKDHFIAPIENIEALELGDLTLISGNLLIVDPCFLDEVVQNHGTEEDYKNRFREVGKLFKLLPGFYPIKLFRCYLNKERGFKELYVELKIKNYDGYLIEKYVGDVFTEACNISFIDYQTFYNNFLPENGTQKLVVTCYHDEKDIIFEYMKVIKTKFKIEFETLEEDKYRTTYISKGCVTREIKGKIDKLLKRTFPKYHPVNVHFNETKNIYFNVFMEGEYFKDEMHVFNKQTKENIIMCSTSTEEGYPIYEQYGRKLFNNEVLGLRIYYTNFKFKKIKGEEFIIVDKY